MVTTKANRSTKWYNKNISYLDLTLSKTKQINWTLEIDYKRKNQNWKLIQNSNKKENKKTGAGC